MSELTKRACLACGATETARGERLLRCSRCKAAHYCCKPHQAKHWEQHRKWCYQREVSQEKWWEKERQCTYCKTKHAWNRHCKNSKRYCPVERKVVDGVKVHEGEVDLIIWPYEEDGCELGWGGVAADKADEFKAMFLSGYDGNEKRFAEYWDNAFRWTCCGSSLGEGMQGCDHHGRGSVPCSCPFCRAGMALPEPLSRHTQTSYGLNLYCGPDPQSFAPLPIQEVFDRMMDELSDDLSR